MDIDLPNKWLINIFFPYVGYLFALFTLSFDTQKFLSLIQSLLALFALVACAFGVIFKNSLLRPMSKTFSHIFSSRSFMILSLKAFYPLSVDFCVLYMHAC